MNLIPSTLTDSETSRSIGDVLLSANPKGVGLNRRDIRAGIDIDTGDVHLIFQPGSGPYESVWKSKVSFGPLVLLPQPAWMWSEDGTVRSFWMPREAALKAVADLTRRAYAEIDGNA